MNSSLEGSSPKVMASMSKRHSTSSRSTLKTSNRVAGGFTSYFRKKKNKQGLSQKDRDRLEAEQKLRDVLQPVQFSFAEEERLKELKKYKRWKQIQRQQEERHRELKAKAMPSIPEARMVSLGEGHLHRDLRVQQGGADGEQNRAIRSMTAALHRHTWEQRIAIVSTLMILLFVSLHADTIGQRVLPQHLFLDNSLVPWYIIVLKDCGVFCHMSACSLIHFALCDVSLIYAFESMELGTKTGPKVKEFYREKVHLTVAAISGGIVAFSICKALVLAWFRMLRDLLETATALLSVGLGAVGGASSSLANSLVSNSTSEFILSAFTGLARLVTGLFIWFVAVVVPFDTDERPLTERVMSFAVDNVTQKAAEAIIVAGTGTITGTQTLGGAADMALDETLEQTLVQTIGSTMAYEEPLTWRDEATDTCQWLLSHSAVFFVTLLVTMHFLTSSYRHKPKTSKSGFPIQVALFSDDHSSIQTSPSMAHDETALIANYSTDTSMETEATGSTRPTSITVTIVDSVTSSKY